MMSIRNQEVGAVSVFLFHFNLLCGSQNHLLQVRATVTLGSPVSSFFDTTGVRKQVVHFVFLLLENRPLFTADSESAREHLP